MSQQVDNPNQDQSDDDNPAEQVQQLSIAGADVIQQSTAKLIDLACRQILMIMPQLPAMWDDSAIAHGLLDFVRTSPKREVMLLINNLDNQLASNHQLVKLSQRVPSRIQLRQVSNVLEFPVMVNDYVMVIDQQHLLRIDDMQRFKGWFDVNYASRAKQYAGSFLQAWPRAKEIAEFRQFYY